MKEIVGSLVYILGYYGVYVGSLSFGLGIAYSLGAFDITFTQVLIAALFQFAVILTIGYLVKG